MKSIMCFILVISCIFFAMIVVFAKTPKKVPQYQTYCNIEGFLCRDWPNRYYTDYVLDAQGQLIPCEFNEQEGE